MQAVEERATLTREVREFDTTFDVRDDSESTVTFEGVASVVDTPYVVRDQLGEFAETVAKGAFTKTLREKADVRLLVNHDGVPLARSKSGTLKLSAAPDLRALAELDPQNPRVQEIRSAVARGDMDQMSIGMRVTKQRWSSDFTEREIRELELFDVSLVTNPASPTTSASVRALDELVSMLTAEDATEDELRRAINHLASLLPPDEAEAEEVVEVITEADGDRRYEVLSQFWDLAKTV